MQIWQQHRVNHNLLPRVEKKTEDEPTPMKHPCWVTALPPLPPLPRKCEIIWNRVLSTLFVYFESVAMLPYAKLCERAWLKYKLLLSTASNKTVGESRLITHTKSFLGSSFNVFCTASGVQKLSVSWAECFVNCVLYELSASWTECFMNWVLYELSAS